MHTVIYTTVGEQRRKNPLYPCGAVIGKYFYDAYYFLQPLLNLPRPNGQWADMMYDKDKNIYAIWGEDRFGSDAGKITYIQIEEKDCPRAFTEMNAKYVILGDRIRVTSFSELDRGLHN